MFLSGCQEVEGDYIQFEIDNETGKILNWESIKDDVLENEDEL